MAQGWPQPELIAEDTQASGVMGWIGGKGDPFLRSSPPSRPDAGSSAQLRLRARLLEFLKFRVLASQEAFLNRGNRVMATMPSAFANGSPAYGLRPSFWLMLICWPCWIRPARSM